MMGTRMPTDEQNHSGEDILDLAKQFALKHFLVSIGLEAVSWDIDNAEQTQKWLAEGGANTIVLDHYFIHELIDSMDEKYHQIFLRALRKVIHPEGKYSGYSSTYQMMMITASVDALLIAYFNTYNGAANAD